MTACSSRGSDPASVVWIGSPIGRGASAMEIYGPYVRKGDGRSYVSIRDNGRKTTKSYPRLLLEQSIGRELSSREEVHHIDHDPTNNHPSNLLVVSKSDHLEYHGQFRKPEIGEFICPTCGGVFQAELRRVRHNQGKQGKSGPYCSKNCAVHKPK